MPWHLPGGPGHFRELTTGGTVRDGPGHLGVAARAVPPAAGPAQRRAHPGPGLAADGADVRHDVGAAIERELAERAEPLWVIGGEQVYRAAMPLADTLVVTEIDQDVDGDAHAPRVDPGEWTLVSSDPERGWLTSTSGLPFRVLRYERVTAS